MMIKVGLHHARPVRQRPFDVPRALLLLDAMETADSQDSSKPNGVGWRLTVRILHHAPELLDLASVALIEDVFENRGCI